MKIKEIGNNADYRKVNDHSISSSTYHKKDGTNLRAKLKNALKMLLKNLYIP